MVIWKMEDEEIEQADVFVVKRIYIDRSKETEKLYELEEKRWQIIKQCTEEWMKLNNIPKGDFWTVGLPTCLYNLLNSVSNKASITACKQYLQDRGADINFKMPRV